MPRTTKAIKKDNTVGLCSICLEYYKKDFYAIKKFGKNLEPAIICINCEKKINK